MHHIGVNHPPDFSHEANRGNHQNFTRRWMLAFGGDQRNADTVWSVAVFENESRDPGKSFDPEECRHATARIVFQNSR